jgi:hypothetical protein
MDLMCWFGPVYCSTLDAVRWERPTYVWCHPLEGASNVTYASQLTSAGNGSPLNALLATAEREAHQKGVPFDAETVGSVGMGGFSAAHQLMNPILKVPGDRARISYVHLADSCFLGAGATNPHEGYAQFAAEAMRGQKTMSITSHGPRGDIHYSGPDGHKYDLTSGSSCVQLFWDAAHNLAGGSDSRPSIPRGLPTPTAAHQIGNCTWLEYDPWDHGEHANKFAAPCVQAFGVPALARGIGSSWLLPGLALVGISAGAAYWWSKNRIR